MTAPLGMRLYCKVQFRDGDGLSFRTCRPGVVHAEPMDVEHRLGEVVDTVCCGEGNPPGDEHASGNATDDEPVHAGLFLGHQRGVDRGDSSRAYKDVKPLAFIVIRVDWHLCAGHFLDVSAQVVYCRQYSLVGVLGSDDAAGCLAIADDCPLCGRRRGCRDRQQGCDQQAPRA